MAIANNFGRDPDRVPGTKSMKSKSDLEKSSAENRDRSSQSGFTLIEVVIAMVVFLVAVLGVFLTVSYAINYNAGNSARTKTLAILQREVERLRSAKFLPCTTANVTTGRIDPLLLGGSTTRTIAASADTDNYSFVITTAVDNDPSSIAVEGEAAINSCNTAFKEIRVTAQLASPSPGWQTAIPATVVMRRVRAN
jgi:prepilin-type N-terminal cleavage/methylation domain-containing protein